MAQKKKTSVKSSKEPATRQSPWALPVVGVVLLALVGGIVFIAMKGASNPPESGAKPTASPGVSATSGSATPALATANPSTSTDAPAADSTMEVARAVMVTRELDFPGTIAEALAQIQRRYQPEDGIGRTFAVLDAYGEHTPEGKLHISMHVSSEKPGSGALVYRPTGEVLWESKIVPRANASATKNLNIYVTDEQGATWIIDGSGVSFLLDAKLRDKAVLVRDFWPDGSERELTIIYSTCGCPVKVKARRMGERVVRTSDLPVIFPDDPDVVATLAKLMRW